MTLQNTNLTNGGLTTNFQVQYQDTLYTSLPPSQQSAIQANIVANANFLLGQVEGTFTTSTGWFGTDTSKFGTSNRQKVLLNLTDGSGANNSGYGNPINVDSQSKNSNISVAGPEVAMVWINEWAEILMSLTGGQWNAGDSSGEGLSQYAGIQLFPAGHYDYYGSWVQGWLNGTGTTNQGTASPNAARSDWVNTTFTGATVGGTFVHGDGDPVSFGCALGFIYYLTVQLGFTINQVISSYSGNLASCYHTLTGDPTDPFPIFTGLLASVYPAGTTATLTGTVPDNPFPIAEVQFYDQKNTFGLDETTDIIKQGGVASAAFWVVINGFSQHSFQTLGIKVGSFTGSFAALQGVTISPNSAGPQFENGVNSTTPQQIRIPFDIKLDNRILSQFPASGVSSPYGLTVSLTSNGTTVSGSQANTQFELIAGADPYFTNIDPTQKNQPYLSQDLRVFSAAPGVSNVPFPNGPTFATDSVTGAYAYIKALLTYLNGNTSFTNGSSDPFTQLPNQSGEGQTDSSVAPFVFNFSNPLIPTLNNNYNFAIARVRLRGSSGIAGQAENVRVFFRMFATQSNDTDFDPTGTYASQPDSAGKPGTPLPGSGNTTIPFFATNNAGSETDYQPGGPNIQTLTIPTNPAGQDSLWWYFGCFLNVYDSNNVVNGQQVQAYFTGTHHCLVAQIAFDDAPIPTGVSPLSWDQLAQRNLQFTAVDNPGPAATHRAPQTFDCRPSMPIGQPGGTGLPPDELMIDWGNVPKGSVASLYWPAVSASEVIALARQWGSTAPLSASDANTLSIPITGGVSYIPIPSGTGQNFAGLFTLELPLGIVTGQLFEVVVRRISTKQRRERALPPPPPPLQSPPAKGHAHAPKPAIGPGPQIIVQRPMQWRYVVGSFVVRVPVSTSPALLVPVATTLAIMKWRLSQLSPANRWTPVLIRYISYLSALLDGVGGNSSEVPPSLTWVPPSLTGGKGCDRTRCGHVAEVLFDCHGDFTGFVLEECCDRHTYETRERAIGDLALRACRERLRVCVTIGEKNGRIVRLAVTT
jgi:hypothetical protein